GADGAEDAEDRLDEKRRIDQAAVEKMREIVEVADIVALELKLGATALAEILQQPLDIGERVFEDEVAGVFEVLRLPVVFPFLVAVEHREEPEIHRPHV